MPKQFDQSDFSDFDELDEWVDPQRSMSGWKILGILVLLLFVIGPAAIALDTLLFWAATGVFDLGFFFGLCGGFTTVVMLGYGERLVDRQILATLAGIHGTILVMVVIPRLVGHFLGVGWGWGAFAAELVLLILWSKLPSGAVANRHLRGAKGE